MSSLVSIALCTYNGERFIREQLDSLLAQTYSNVEIIIIDDASTDGTFDILRTYKMRNQRIKLFQNESNIGYSQNFIKAISACTGNFIAFCDQDDVWLPQKIEVLLAEIGDDLLIYHDSAFMDEDGNLTGKSMQSLHHFVDHRKTLALLLQNCASGHSIMIRRELLSSLPPLPNGLYYDWWIMYTAACLGKVRFIGNTLVNYRIHLNNVTKNDREDNTTTRILTLHAFREHPLTAANTRQLINSLLSGYQQLNTKRFSILLFAKLLFNRRKLFYIRKRSLPSKIKAIIKESTNFRSNG